MKIKVSKYTKFFYTQLTEEERNMLFPGDTEPVMLGNEIGFTYSPIEVPKIKYSSNFLKFKEMTHCLTKRQITWVKKKIPDYSHLRIITFCIVRAAYDFYN